MKGKKRNEYSIYYNSKHNRSVCLSTVLDVLEKLGTPKSVSMAICLRYKTFDKSAFDICPSNYFDAYSYYLDAQAIALVKKSVWFMEPDEQELSSKAISQWKSIEDDLSKKNLEIAGRKNFGLNSILDSAAKIIGNLLPKTPDERLDVVRIPTGASALLTGLDVNIANKLEVLDITPSAWPYFRKKYGSTVLAKSYNSICSSLGSVFDTVPKDFFKVRTICKEPMGNMSLQLEAAQTLRYALKKVGIDLETQQEFHGFLVRKFWDTYATIDLSDASDRISTELVKALLPLEWYTYLNRIRSQHVFIDGERRRFEKFSPQGNGFTFELETLIFWAICTATLNMNNIKGLVSVYGDDMIVPKEGADLVQQSLHMCGFVVNKDKSFTDGYFKESCGVDTFKGIDVRPIYLKSFRKGLFGYYELYNRIVEIEENLFPGALTRPKKRILSHILEKHKAFGPKSLGDIVLHAEAYKVLYHGQIRVIRSLQHRQIKLDDDVGKVYLSVCRTGRPDHELAYALLGFSSDGTLLRNAPQSEEFRRVCLTAL